MSKSITIHYFLYKTTNLINGKIYVGKHKTKKLDDGYIGSGKLLKRAITKYGRENFKFEILGFYESEELLNKAELEVVTEEFCLREDTYNLCVGGRGGFSYINRKGLNIYENHHNQLKINLQGGNQRKQDLRNTDPKWKQRVSVSISKGQKRYYETNPGKFTGRSHTAETKRLQSLSSKRSTKISINSVVYTSLTEAKNATGEWHFIIKRKLASDEFPDYKYL